jgi:hypothetical protein
MAIRGGPMWGLRLSLFLPSFQSDTCVSRSCGVHGSSFYQERITSEHVKRECCVGFLPAATLGSWQLNDLWYRWSQVVLKKREKQEKRNKMVKYIICIIFWLRLKHTHTR